MADIRARTRAPSRFTIRLNGWYNRSTRLGRLQAWVKNEGTSSYTGVLQRVIVEDSTWWSGTYQYYQNQAMRKMYPNASGVTLTIPAGDSVLKDTTFSISASWRQDSCMIVVFLQNTQAQGDTIQQGAQARVKAMTAIEEEAGEVYPQNISLALKSANPFSRFVDIGYALPMDTKVTLKVYNSSGQVVRTLVDGQAPHGYHTARFDGAGLPNGVYLVMLRDRESLLTRKVTLLR